MKALAKRLGALELSSGLGGGWDFTKPCHQVILHEGQPYAEALAEYRAKHPDKVIEPNHNVIWRRIVSPVFDAVGAIIPKEPPKQSFNQGPSLGDVMEASR